MLVIGAPPIAFVDLCRGSDVHRLTGGRCRSPTLILHNRAERGVHGLFDFGRINLCCAHGYTLWRRGRIVYSVGNGRTVRRHPGRTGKILRITYDYIVVGGGAAGCVMARRLAEDPDVQVLLIEAGPSDGGVASIAKGSDWASLMGGPYDWGYAYEPSPHVNDRTIPIPRGKVLGGSSSTNAMLWYRGHPSDYDAWDCFGATGWGFDALLPYFRRSEDWEGGATSFRGAGGPMRVERPRDPHPVATTMLEAARELGFSTIDDANAATNEGATLANFNMRGDERWSAARGYLAPAADWPNLTILVDSQAVGLGFEGTQCTTVRHRVGGAIIETRADREIVLTLGAIDTPRLLILSGIGAPDDLRALGLRVTAALPGVGQNFQDHPLLMGVNFRARAPLAPVRGNGGGAMLNWRSRHGLSGPDLHAFIVQSAGGRRDIADKASDVFAIAPGLMRSKSRGFLRLVEARPNGRLTIQPNLLANPDDLAALVDGLDTVMDLAETAAYREMIAAPVFDRRMSKATKIAFVRDNCSTFYHCCGSCAMGEGDAAVVDSQLRVRGVDGLRIADASIIPVIPSCNTQAPVIMIAERTAALMRQAT